MTQFLAIFALIAAVIIFDWLSDDETPRRPDLTDNEVTDLPGPSENDPVVVVSPDEPCPRVCRGTAIAIDRKGHWLTARHVTRGCRRLEIISGRSLRIPVVQAVNSARADISLLVTRSSVSALPFNLSALRSDQNGFHFGYPKGKPGEVHSLLLGRTRVREGRQHEPGIAWAEVSRNPPREGSLGGISGGAVLDRSGRIVGITTLEVPRRGRIISAAPESLLKLLKANRLGALAVASKKLGKPITPRTYPEVGRRLRAGHSVAKVLCFS